MDLTHIQRRSTVRTMPSRKCIFSLTRQVGLGNFEFAVIWNSKPFRLDLSFSAIGDFEIAPLRIVFVTTKS